MEPKLFDKNKKNPSEIQKHLPVNVNTTFEVISPFLGQCEIRYIVPLLGKALFDKLVSHYQSEEKNEEYDKLIDYIQFSLVRLAYWHGYDVLSVNLSDAGAKSMAGRENQLYRYQHENIKKSLKNEGFDQLDIVLDFLYENLETFKEFEESEYFQQNQKTLIRSIKEYNAIYNINNSRLVFQKMMYYVRIVEDTILCHRLGKAFVNELLTDTENEIYKNILPDIKKYIVFQSIAQGISELKKLPTDKGLVFDNQDPFGGAGFADTPVPLNEVQQTMAFYSDTAERYLSAVIDYMKRNKEDYPLFFEFAGDDAPETTIFRRDNRNKKTVWL